MHYLWNVLHLVNVESFIGEVNIYHSSDWTQGPSQAKKVTTVHDLSPFLYPAETDPQIVAVHAARMKWVVKECDKIICVSIQPPLTCTDYFQAPSAGRLLSPSPTG